MLMVFGSLAWDCPCGLCLGMVRTSPSADVGGKALHLMMHWHQAGRRQPIPSHETQAACAALCSTFWCKPGYWTVRGVGLPGGLVAQLVRAHA